MLVDLPAGQFEYLEKGPGADPDTATDRPDAEPSPAVLLHGLRGDASRWDLVVPELAKHRRVLALTQRGHGASARTPEYSFEGMRDDLLAFADSLGLDRFLLVGHSMGGTVAAIFAEQHSDRLTGLVLVDSPPPDGDGDWTVPPYPDEEPDFDWACLQAIFAQLAAPDRAWTRELAKITVPTLVVGGGSTSPVPQHLLAEAAAAIPDATLATIEGAGHNIPQTRPTDLLTTITTHFPT